MVVLTCVGAGVPAHLCTERWHFPWQGHLVAEGWHLTLLQPVCQTSRKSYIRLRVRVRADSSSARSPKTEASRDHGSAGGEPGAGGWCTLYPCLCERKAVSNKKRRRFCLCFSPLLIAACLPPRAPIHPAGSQLQHVPLAQQLCSASGPLSLWTLPSNLPACLPACLGNLGWLCPIFEMNDCCPPGLIAHVSYSFVFSRAPLPQNKPQAQ